MGLLGYPGMKIMSVEGSRIVVPNGLRTMLFSLSLLFILGLSPGRDSGEAYLNVLQRLL